MGRKTLKMERIANEKTRVTTYKKRKTCLLKKAKEFSTLCGVDTCLIIYGPNGTAEEATAKPETWPTDENKVHDIIGKYRDTAASSCRKTFQIHDFLSERAKNTDNKVRTSKRVKYRTWDEELGKCSPEELSRILGDVDDKIDKAQRHISLLEESRRQNRALVEASRAANQQALCGYNHIEQQQLLPWSHLGHVGFPISYSHDPVTMDSIKALMMLSRHDGYGLFPGFYGGPEAYIGPHWTQENIVFNGADQLTSNSVFDPQPVQSLTQVNKWGEDSSKDLM